MSCLPTLTYRSYLYVPATKIERVAKAFVIGADTVIVDWEDAVADTDKALARELTQTLPQHTQQSVWLRINAVDSSEYALDIQAIAHLPQLQGLFLPKAHSAEEIEQLHQISGLPIIAIIETAQGVLNIAQIAKAKGLAAFSFGCLDLAHDLGMNPDSQAAKQMFNRLRMDLVLHSTAQGLNSPIDTVFADFHDDAGFSQQVKDSQDLGLVGMMCIHPRQVTQLHQLLQPDAAELAFAKQICAFYQQSGQAVFQLNGKMVDMPVIKRAMRLCAQYHDVN